MEGKGDIWHSEWHQWKFHLSVVDEQKYKCKSCSEYIWTLDILLQPEKGTFIEKRIIESNVISLVRVINVCHFWNSV